MIEGQQVVAADRQSEDPIALLQDLLQEHVPENQAGRIREYMDGLRTDIRGNRRTDISCQPLLSGLSREQRIVADAVVADIGVFLTQRRDQVLRDAHAGKLTNQDLDRLFLDVCLGQQPALDPDLAKVATQAIVRCSTQRELIARTTIAFDRIRAETETPPGTDERSGNSLLPLGKLLAFLRWVPHGWAEEIALDVLDTVHPCKRIDRLRVWISVLRVFFCRPSVGAASVARILHAIEDEFGWPAPMELRNLIRTILIKGGEESERTLLQCFDQNPEEYETEFFLDNLGMMDKPAAAEWLLDRRDALLAKLGVDTFLKLLTTTGETNQEARAVLVGLWERGDTETRLRCLDTIEELHFAELTPFLLSGFSEHRDSRVQFRIVDAVVASAGADDLLSLAACVRDERPALRYYTLHLAYGRLLDTPALLVEEKVLALVRGIQDARADLYEGYRSLLSLRDLLLRRQDDTADEGAKDGAAVNTPWRDALARAVAGLDDAGWVAGRVRGNIFGQVSDHGFARDLLRKEDLSTLAINPGAQDPATAVLLAKTERSIAFLLDVFLWQEWFIREVPFVLSEDIGLLIERVQKGESIAFDTGWHSDPDQRNRLKTTLGISYACSRQGIYLTDVLLTHIRHFPRENWPQVIENDLTRRRVMVADGRLVYHPDDPLARHLQFTTYAHDYRYGKESLDQAPMLYLWLRYIRETERIRGMLEDGPWPDLPAHPAVPQTIGPLTGKMYEQHACEATAVAGLIGALHERSRRDGFEIRVIPNLTYGLFCLAPVMEAIVRRGIHVSLAGVSSQLCDDENISRFSLRDENAFPLKRYVFSNASNYGTLNTDRVLVVIDGTMEPMDRHDTAKIRLPKAYRGFVNHLAAINYVRARFGYGMESPERDVASALNLPLRFVRNLVRTHDFRHLLDSLLRCFDPERLTQAHAAAGTGRTYYTFAQWNPDGMPARIGPIGYEKREIPCTPAEDLPCPSLLFVSMNSIFNEMGVAAYFDNSPEVEHPRMFIGPQGVKIDIGWPGPQKGIELAP